MTQQCETEKSNMIYQIDGVIIKQFISRQLGGI
jgi:NAD-dependent DNA ligase